MKHKFINKKAGAEARVIAIYLDSDGVMQVDGYDTVEDLMDDYAAYGKYEPPKEPLIKDEKIRKAVRAWAEVLEVNEVEFYGSRDWIGLLAKYDGADWSSKFELDCYGSENTLVTDKKYTISELCGEEEE